MVIKLINVDILIVLYEKRYFPRVLRQSFGVLFKEFDFFTFNLFSGLEGKVRSAGQIRYPTNLIKRLLAID